MNAIVGFISEGVIKKRSESVPCTHWKLKRAGCTGPRLRRSQMKPLPARQRVWARVHEGRCRKGAAWVSCKKGYEIPSLFGVGVRKLTKEVGLLSDPGRCDW